MPWMTGPREGLAAMPRRPRDGWRVLSRLEADGAHTDPGWGVSRMTVGPAVDRDTWVVAGGEALRRLAAVTLAGAVLGLLLGGMGGRLAMMLLARLNPEFTGTTSDDGFTIGQLTTDSFNLLMVTTLIGVLGGGVYFALRGLMVGPRWFQVLSISVGPAIVVGGMLVHRDGVDFMLEPAGLAIAMFVAIPGVYAALLALLAERWLTSGGWFMSAPVLAALSPLLLWIPLAPLLAVLLLGVATYQGLRRTAWGAAALGHPAWPWLLRAALVVLFAVALVGLIRDITALT